MQVFLSVIMIISLLLMIAQNCSHISIRINNFATLLIISKTQNHKKLMRKFLFFLILGNDLAYFKLESEFLSLTRDE